MAFFDEIYASPAWAQAVERIPSMSFAPRATHLPGRLQWERPLATTENVCVALDSVACWPEHFSADIVVFARKELGEGDEFAPFPGGLSTGGLRYDVQGIRLGIQFSDGRRATNLITPRRTGSQQGGLLEEVPFFTPQGWAGGGGGSSDRGLWKYTQQIDLWPLPRVHSGVGLTCGFSACLV